jgi:probable HAF family extracellular repeat protein
VAHRPAVLALAAVVSVGTATGAMLALATAGAVKSPWVIRDLGTLDGLDSTPVAINDHGEVAGYGYGQDVAGRAFLWKNGRLTDLGRCGHYSRAVAINERGQVVGSCAFRPSGKPDHAFLWQNRTLIDLGTLGWTSSDAVAINAKGQVVGTRFRGNEEHAFLWQRGKMTDLGTLGGTRSEATAINDRGQVVGDSTTSDGEQHAFLWQHGKMTDLGVLGGGVSTAFGGIRNEQFQPTAINNRAQIVGLAHNPTGSYEIAFLWEHRKLTTFGSFGGQPNRAVTINAHGQVLLRTEPPSDKRGDAYLWQKGKLRKLGSFDPDMPATFVSGLNDRGQIVGRSLVAIGHSRPFVWQSGSMTALPTLGGQDTAPFTSVSAINDRGQIVGSSYTAVKKHTELHLVMWTRRSGR